MPCQRCSRRAAAPRKGRAAFRRPARVHGNPPRGRTGSADTRPRRDCATGAVLGRVL